MTEVNLDIGAIKRTQEALGKFVKKPPLTEKLLRKPPFKFIHDVIKVVSLKELHEKLFKLFIVLSIQPEFVIFVFCSAKIDYFWGISLNLFVSY